MYIFSSFKIIGLNIYFKKLLNGILIFKEKNKFKIV